MMCKALYNLLIPLDQGSANSGLLPVAASISHGFHTTQLLSGCYDGMALKPENILRSGPLQKKCADACSSLILASL